MPEESPPVSRPSARSPAAAPNRETIVIVGAGIAGVTAAQYARLTAPEATITLLCKEDGLPYYRLNLTRMLSGEVAESELALQSSSWFAEQQIELRHDAVSSIDRATERLQLSSGGELPYDRLVLAIGAHAFVPPIVGATRQGVYALRTLADAQAMLAQATRAKRAICVGGGVLGLETAGALQRQGLDVLVLEGFDWLLPRQLAKAAGDRLQQQLEAKGIAVRCGVRIEALVGDEEVRAVRLESGEELDADLVVLATGVRPNSYLARQSGLEVAHGVVVDDRMATSDPAIYAAGDVAEHRGVVYGLWPHAYAEGMVAGVNAAGGAMEFRGMPPSNRLKVQGIDLFSIGRFERADGSDCLVEQQDAAAYYRLVLRDGRIVGANLLGDTALAASLKTWIEQASQVAEIAELQAKFAEIAELCR